MKLRSYLLLVVVTSVLPLLIFSVVMVMIHHQEQRDALQRSMLNTARALSSAVDREIEATIDVLQALGSSEHLESGDLRQFYEQSRRVLITQKPWSTIILFDSGARQVMNLLRPLGSPLPKDPPASPWIKNTIDLKRPLVSDLFIGRIPGQPRIAVNVPIIRGGQVR